MTMDYGQQSRADLKLSSPRVGTMESPTSIVTAAHTNTTDIVQTKLDTNPSSTTKSPAKRSFDVAFLIRPDENMKHKQARTNMLAIATEQAAYHQHIVQHQPHELVRLNHNHRQSPDVEDTTPSPSSLASPTPPQPSPSHNLTPQPAPLLHHISVKSDEVLRGGSVVGSKHQSPPPPPQPQRYAEFQNGEQIASDMLINRSDYDRYNRVLAVRMPRVYDHPSAIVLSATAASDTIVVDDKKDEQPRSAFTKVPSQHHHQLIQHLQQQTQHQIHHHQFHQHHQHHQHQHPNIESPPGPVASPDRLSCPSISPPVSITPPASRAASITQSPPPPMPSPSASQILALSSAPSSPQSHLMYQNFRPEYRQFVSAAAAAGQFQTISHHLQQAAAVSQQQQHQFKQHQQHHQHQQQQQFMYRTSAAANSPAAAAAAAAAAIAANAEHMSHINKFMGTPQQFAAVQQHFAAQQHQQHQHNQQQLQQHHHHHHHHNQQQLQQQQQQQQQQQHHQQHQQQQHQQHPQHAELAAAAVRHPVAAAALLTSLIPPTLATSFTLTAQNVCAKCNISFRMTSDLVYHMRSHHKSEFTADTNRRKREEKLKCPVCNESFRERHHLTRHMTAHQDKASDEAPPSTAANTSGGSHGSTSSEMGGLHSRMRHHK